MPWKHQPGSVQVRARARPVTRPPPLAGLFTVQFVLGTKTSGRLNGSEKIVLVAFAVYISLRYIIIIIIIIAVVVSLFL